MDTKLKKSRNIDLKNIIIFFITIGLFITFIGSTLGLIVYQRDNLSKVFEKNYYESEDFSIEITNILRQLEDLIIEYKSEENIKAGNLLNTSNSLYNQQKESMFEGYLDNKKDRKEIPYEITEEDRFKYFKDFEEEEKEEIEKLKERVIGEQLNMFRQNVEELKELKGVHYLATNGKEVFTNEKGLNKKKFKTFPAYILLDRNGGKSYPEEIKSQSFTAGYTVLDTSLTNDRAIYLGLDDEFLTPRIKEWEEGKNKVLNYPAIIGVSFLLTLIGFIRLVFLAGRKSDEDGLYMRKIDKVYTDISVFLIMGLIFTWLAMTMIFYDVVLNSRLDNNIILLNTSFLSISAIMAVFGLSLILSLVRHFKNGTLIKNSFIYILAEKSIELVKELSESSGTFKGKVIFSIFLYTLLISIFPFLFPVILILGVINTLKKLNDFERIQEGVVKIKEGDLDYKIKVDSQGEFEKLASNINDISYGLKNAVDRELASERARSELITNVSHDIRTPLTSIITYIDLLKYEKNQGKQKEYIDVLDKKSKRLKKLIDDLFQATKVSSGDIPVNLMDIDIVSLITQGLGELDDKIKETELDFHLNAEEELFVKADGDLLWRAIENLFSNIFKYSLKGSRVYIDITSDDNYAYITMKNISAYKLNISEEELMERFKRGDESRTSEGSGLGLSITESLISIQKGKFEIEIDGDLFKTRIILPKN